MSAPAIDTVIRRVERAGTSGHGVPLYRCYGELFGVVADATAQHVYAGYSERSGGYQGTRVSVQPLGVTAEAAIARHLVMAAE